jgi:hypothetical protein
MDDFVVGMVLGVVLSSLIWLFGMLGAVSGVKESVSEDCDNFGAFMVDDVKYECRRAE